MKKRIAKKNGVSKYPETKKQLVEANINLRKKVHDLEDNYKGSKANAEYLASELVKCKATNEMNMALIEEKDVTINNQVEILTQKGKECESLKSKYKECSELANSLMLENDELESERADAEHKCDMLIEENYKLKKELEYARLPWWKKVFRE